MKFLARLFAEIIALIFMVFMAAGALNTEHSGVTGMVIVSVLVVALALRATIQREVIKDDARERRRLEEAFVSAASEAGWPRLVKVHHDRKVVSYYIRTTDDDFYIEAPLREESLDEPIQLVDILSPEDVEKFYADADEDEEVNTTAAEEE